MRLEAGQMPVQALLLGPFVPLAEVLAHEEHLLAGMRPHEPVVQPERGEPLPEIAPINASGLPYETMVFDLRDRNKNRWSEIEGKNTPDKFGTESYHRFLVRKYTGIAKRMK